MCFVCSCMDPLPHPNSAMDRIWGLWVDKCVTCDILLWDTWQLMPEWQDSSRTLFPLQAKQNPLSYSCSYLPKSPSWGTVQLPCCLSMTTTSSSEQPPHSSEGHCGTGVCCPSAIGQGKTRLGPFTKNNMFRFFIAAVSWLAFPTFSFLSGCGGLGLSV